MVRFHCGLPIKHPDIRIKKVRFRFEFVYDHNVIEAEAKEGETLLNAARLNGIDLESSCGGNAICSSCHCILTPEYYTSLPH